MKKQLLNHQSQKTGTRYFLSLLVFLCALCTFAGNARGQIDSIAETIIRGTTEQKRDALARIRNSENETYSRLAVPALTDKSEIVRATAASSVVFLPEDEALVVLSPLLNDKKEFVRREAACALGKTGSPNAVNALLRVLQKDKVLEVRSAAIIALGEIGDASAVPELVRILQRKPNDKEEFTRRSAARSAGQIAQIIQTDKTKVQTPEDSLSGKYVFVAAPKYKNLVEAFPAFGAANAALIGILQNRRESGDVRREAAFALGAIGDTSAIAVLQSNTNADDYYLAEISRQALHRIRLSRKLTDDN